MSAMHDSYASCAVAFGQRCIGRSMRLSGAFATLPNRDARAEHTTLSWRNVSWLVELPVQ